MASQAAPSNVREVPDERNTPQKSTAREIAARGARARTASCARADAQEAPGARTESPRPSRGAHQASTDSRASPKGADKSEESIENRKSLS